MPVTKKSPKEMEKELLSMGEKYPYANLYAEPFPKLKWVVEHVTEILFAVLLLVVVTIILY